MKKRIAAVNIVIIITILFLSVNVSAYTYYDISRLMSSDELKSCVDSSMGLYVAGKVGNDFEMWHISASGARSCSFFTDGLKNEAFSGCNGTVAAVFSKSSVSGNSQLQVFTHNFNTDKTEIFSISSTIGGENGFALGKNCWYVVQNDLRTIRMYSLSGKFQYSVYSENYIYQLIYDNASSTLYAAYDGGVCILKENGLYDLGRIATPVTLAGKSTLSSSDGGLYAVKGQALRHICDVPIGNKAVFVGNMAYYSSGSVLYGKKSSGELVSKLDTGEHIQDILPCGSKVSVISSSGILSVIDSDEMAPVQKPTEPNNTGGASNTNSTSNSRPPSSDNQNNGSSSGKRGIYSSVYNIDNSKMIISGIKHGTTIAEFKSKMSFNGYKASFKNYKGISKTSGNVGTGFTVRFSGENERSYTLIVSGDLTGEGNINSLDVRQYMRFLCGKTALTSPFMTSFDINGDNMNDTLDLLIAAKQWENDTQ